MGMFYLLAHLKLLMKQACPPPLQYTSMNQCI